MTEGFVFENQNELNLKIQKKGGTRRNELDQPGKGNQLKNTKQSSMLV